MAQGFFRNAASAEQTYGQITVIVDQRGQRHPGEIAMGEYSVEPMAESCASATLYDATHYQPDKGDGASPQETMSASGNSVAHGDLADHQSVERYNYKLQRAHMIDKSRCTGALDALNKDDSNFLALSPSLHDQYDGRNIIGAEAVAIKIDQSRTDQQGQRATVDLLVIPDTDQTAAFLAANLGDYVAVGSWYRVSVHVKDVALFTVCASWKYNKTVKGWRERGRLPSGVEPIEDYNFGLLKERFGEHDLDEE